MSRSKRRPKYNFNKNGPSWWRHGETEVPNRRKTRALEHAVAQGQDPDAIIWPKWNRPIVYFW